MSGGSAGDSLTKHGIAVGTPAFMAPEQAAGATNEIGPATDIWGLGATLFQLLTGRPVHDVTTEAAGVESAATTAAPPIRAFAPGLPPQLAKVIDRALSFNASDRWPSASSLQRALVLARDQGTSREPEAGQDTTSRGRLRREPEAFVEFP